jgi:hypothetical protein
MTIWYHKVIYRDCVTMNKKELRKTWLWRFKSTLWALDWRILEKTQSGKLIHGRWARLDSSEIQLGMRHSASPSGRSVCGRSPAEILGSNPAWSIDVCCECCVLSGRGLCDEMIARTRKPCWLCCVVVCGIEAKKIRTPWHAFGRSDKGKKKKNEYAISRSRSCCDTLMFDRRDVNIFLPLNVREKSQLPPSFNR